MPSRVRFELGARLADPRFAGLEVSASVWIEGWGEVATRDPDRELLPASNQKLVTAMGASELLDQDATLSTAAVASGPVAGGVVDGDLLLVGGGDPTLTRAGPHSLAALARQVRAAGITTVRGSVVVDESRFDAKRDAPGWFDWHRPDSIGSLSAVIVDRNQYRRDARFLADPALVNAELWRDELTAAGVMVKGPVRSQHGPTDGRQLAAIASPSIGALVKMMLARSDNLIAEVLVKEIGHRERGDGSTNAGLEAIESALAAQCVIVGGHSADGSGLSRENRRSARQWSELLRQAIARPWWPALRAGLPAGGLTGTVRTGDVHAKGGSILTARALSGYATTAAGRPAVFSVVVNGSSPQRAERAVDDLVLALTRVIG